MLLSFVPQSKVSFYGEAHQGPGNLPSATANIKMYHHKINKNVKGAHSTPIFSVLWKKAMTNVIKWEPLFRDVFLI